MNLAIITPRYPPTHAGGGEISARLLAEQLHDRGLADVTVYSFDGDSTETVGGVPVRRLADVPQYPYTLPNEIAYRKLATEEIDADVVHAYNMHLHPAVGRLSNRIGVPAVATLNAYPLLDWKDIGVTPSLQRRIYESTLLRVERPRLLRQIRNIELFVPLSDAVGQVYQTHGLGEASYKTIPNMLDPSFEVPTDKQTKVRRSDRTRLLYVGYLRDSKGVRYLVDAMAQLPSSFELTIVGDGPKKSELESQATKSLAADRIEFAGSIPYDEVTSAYKNTDIFVHPGVWPEPFGRTILEAMQAGLPVVATNVGGPGEIVPDEELLCAPGDPQDLAESIKYAAKRQDEIGAENRQYVRKHYHPNVVVPQFVDAYERVLAE